MDKFIDNAGREWAYAGSWGGPVDSDLWNNMWTAYAYMVGYLTPEPTDEDLREGQLWSFLFGQTNRNPHIRSAIGYTPNLSWENLKRYINKEADGQLPTE